MNEYTNKLDIAKEKIINDVCNQLDIVKTMLKKDEVNKSCDFNKKLNLAYNRIIFGAPGTGKSYRLKKDIQSNKLDKLFRRVTFYPNYTYSQFVGSYKPVGKTIVENNIEREVVTYEFVPGPFLNVLIEALKDEKNEIPHILIIEEINRANPAGVFGDVFQLLDRDLNGDSTYKISMSNEMKKYVCKELNKNIEELYIPSNMYIWATMNSADQGVYPMDSAFKRRWSFEYIGIDENQEFLKGSNCEFIKLKNESGGYTKYEWNTVRTEINRKLKDIKVNEDKLLGPFFLNESEIMKSEQSNIEFDNIFKSKVLMYLYEDILKHKKSDFFSIEVQNFSDIIKAYDSGDVFNFKIESYREIEYDLEESSNYSIASEEESPFEIKE
ncbi:MAG: AAA family ATPase [Romboutsia timonensis]|nr:AAA family ATPase [uncultured Romboutsia sp.]